MNIDMISIGSPLLWSAFFIIVIGMLCMDIFFIGGGGQHRVSFKEAACWSIVWVLVTLLFAAGLWSYLQVEFSREVANIKVIEFITGYLVEKSLAVDNVFVWLMIFSFFSIPLELQKRVLIYGVFGAIVMRAIMIFAGVWLIAQFHWILYLFGAFLLFTGIKMFFAQDEAPDLNQNRGIIWLRKHMRVTEQLHDERFIIIKQGLRYATPLLLVLILVEISDIIFAVDSIPAIFAITQDPFILLTSNLFAILGLRAMYFLVADIADRFHYLQHGLAFVLIFIGAKMLLIDIYKIPSSISLGVVAFLIFGSVALSLIKSQPAKKIND